MTKLRLSDVKPADARTDALVITLAEGEGMAAYKDIDRAMDGVPGKAIAQAEFRGKAEETLVIHTHGKLKAARLVLAGLGPKDKINAERCRQAGGRAASAVRSAGGRTMAVVTKNAADMAEGALLSQYEFTRYKKGDPDRKPLSEVTLLVPKPQHAKLAKTLATVSAVTGAACFARDLVNTPGREMTPSIMASAAKSIKGLRVRVIERAEAARLGMHSYLSVSDGSHEPPKFIIAEWRGGRKSGRPVVLVGKSITFDSGGLSLKPSDGMEKMKYDMAGGAAVLGALMAASALKIPHNVIGVLPATENLPSARPTRPGDVVRAINGKTIEILNTDAEGRLALADALGYAVKYLKPREVVDIATLTGACASALGEEAMALFANSDDLAARIARAADETGERAWRMPLYDEYAEYMKSSFADLQNISAGRSGGLVTAGWFLSQFVDDTPWAHLDIANCAWRDKPRAYTPRGASGIGVRLFVKYLQNLP